MLGFTCGYMFYILTFPSAKDRERFEPVGRLHVCPPHVSL